MSRITYTIAKWFGGRWRADMLVDNHRVEKAYFDTYAQALAWCLSKETELAQEVKGEIKWQTQSFDRTQ